MKNKYAWASITKSCTNFGNYLIEDNLNRLLEEKGIDKPSFTFDAFANYSAEELAIIQDKINTLGFVVIPGCTTLTTRFYPGIQAIVPKVKIPVFNIGAAFGVKSDKDSIDFTKYYFSPIGTRDPVSNNILKSSGYESTLIGCPTLFSGKANSFEYDDNGAVLFNFGVKNYKPQIELLDYLIASGEEVNVIIQTEEQRGLIEGKKCKIIEYTPQNIIEAIKKSKITITGRLHASLPALSNGKPVFFIETIKDSRFSLLTYIGLKFHQPHNLVAQYKNFRPENEKIIYSRINELKSKFTDYLDYLPS